VLAPKNPIVCSLPACCARATSGHAAIAPPTDVMNSRRFNCIRCPQAGSPGQDTVLASISQGLAAVRNFDPTNDRLGSRVSISLGERRAPYHRIDPKPDLDSTLKCIGGNGREVPISVISPSQNL